MKNAKKINEAWELIETYFYDLTGRLKNELAYLDDTIKYHSESIDGKNVIEFSIKHAGGLRFEKSTYEIVIKTLNDDCKYEDEALLECIAGFIVVDRKVRKEFDEAMIDKWVKEGIYNFLES